MATSNGGFIGVTLDPIFEKITTFTSSGNFTPQVSTGTDEVEVLVISGGGGGASRYGGGGGGGGVDTVTTLEVAADTAYPVVVGGGGAGGAASGGSGTSGAGDGTIGTTSSFAGSGITTIATLGGGGGGAGDTRDGLRGGSGGGGAGGGSTSTTDGGSAVAAHAITAFGDTNHATAQSKHGTTSLEFDGTGDWLRLNDTGAFDWGTDDFTIEYWWYVTRFTGSGSPFSFGWSSSNDNGLAATSHTVYSGGEPGISQYWMFDGNDLVVRGDTYGSAMNEWQHWAFVVDNGDVEIYLDGALTVSSAGANPDIGGPASSRDYYIGVWRSDPHYSYHYEGYLDDFRVSSNARYTTTFTPPTSQLPHDSDTILLIQSNSSDGNTTFTDLSQGTLGREGYIGGNGGNASPYYQGAGGGGGGAAAANSTGADTATNGAGGIGYSNAISGTATYYAGGGGGGDDATSGSKSYAASGGTGGGGAGGGQNGGATTGTVNTGGGGGGGGWVSSANVAGAAGGSGVVIVKETATGNSGIYNMDDVYAYSIDNKW